MATTTMGVSTIGVKFGWATETTAGSKPAAFTQIERCNAIAGVDISVENIDASALEDESTKRIPGRTNPADSVSITFNLTDDTMTQIEAMIAAYEALTDGKRMWIDIYNPHLAKSVFIVAAPPTAIPMPAMDQNNLLTVQIPFTIEDYKGWDTAIEPTAAA